MDLGRAGQKIESKKTKTKRLWVGSRGALIYWVTKMICSMFSLIFGRVKNNYRDVESSLE